MTQGIALITGASAGIGAEFARQVGKSGKQLVLVARRKDRLDSLVAELGNARAVAIDLGEAGAAKRLLADIEAAGEHVETLVNNAGFGLAGKFAKLDGPRQRAMIDLNIGALTDLTHAVLPGMIERKRGGILNVASTAAFQPGPGMAVYFASKAYVLSFTEALHEELRGSGIRVTALCPGPTATEFGEVAGFGKEGAFAKYSVDAASVVAAGLAGLDKGKAIVIPGLLNKFSAQGHRFLSRSTLRRIAGALKF